jgi:hypothetical protein
VEGCSARSGQMSAPKAFFFPPHCPSGPSASHRPPPPPNRPDAARGTEAARSHSGRGQTQKDSGSQTPGGVRREHTRPSPVRSSLVLLRRPSRVPCPVPCARPKRRKSEAPKRRGRRRTHRQDNTAQAKGREERREDTLIYLWTEWQAKKTMHAREIGKNQDGVGFSWIRFSNQIQPAGKRGQASLRSLHIAPVRKVEVVRLAAVVGEISATGGLRGQHRW